MNMSESRMIVTACDQRFLWGAFIFIGSLRYHGVKLPVHVVTFDVTEADRRLLEGLENVKTFPADTSNPRNIACQKATAILTSDAEHIAWIDSDCLCTGDITPLIEAPDRSIQIRMRPAAEIAYLFRRRYAAGEPRGPLPKVVLDTWRKDVGERAEPRINTSCNAFSFVIHRQHLDFVRKWERQIEQVIPPQDFGIVNDRSISYFLLDEAVMSSLLAFANDAPAVSPFRLANDPAGQVIHFGGMPKPWTQWMTRNIEYFDAVVTVVEWLQQQGIQTPPVPWNLKRENRGRAVRAARLFEVKRRLLHLLWDTAKRIRRWCLPRKNV